MAPKASGEEFSGGSAGELAIDTNLLRGPQEDSEIIGKLPKGTILNLLGNSAGKWIKIEVELVDGVEQGWIDESSLKSGEEAQKKDSDSESASNQKKEKRKKRRRIPEDEMAVLKRESTFLYGIYGGGNYGILSTNTSLLQGMGLQGGGFVSFFLNREMTLGLEIGGTQLAGSQSGDGSGIGSSTVATAGTARLVDIAAVYEYLYRDFRFFGVAQYSMGVGIDDFLPDDPPSASDFSGLWLKLGAGYSLELSPVLSIVFKGFYGYSFNRAYVGFQNLGFSAYLEFRG